MCDPMTLTALALAGGSAVANNMAANKVTAERNDAMAAERIRQKGYDKETSALNTQSQDRYKGFGEKQDATAAQLGDYFSDASKPAAIDDPNSSAGSVLPSSSNNIVTAENNKQQGQADAFSNQQAQALGTLRSFGDLLGDTSLLQGRDASKIGQIGGFKRGSAAVLPYELEEASHAGGGLRFYGDLLGGASMITGMGGGPLASMFSKAAPVTRVVADPKTVSDYAQFFRG